MSKMESKKLQTRMVNGEACPKIVSGNLLGCIDAWEHDARIAHEQREVIRKMELALRITALTLKGLNPNGSGMTLQKIDDTRAAAAPYLQED